MFYCLTVNKFIDDYSKAEDISSVASLHIGSLFRLPGESRAKYFVDEVLEKIENIIICITFHKLL